MATRRWVCRRAPGLLVLGGKGVGVFEMGKQRGDVEKSNYQDRSGGGFQESFVKNNNDVDMEKCRSFGKKDKSRFEKNGAFLVGGGRGEVGRIGRIQNVANNPIKMKWKKSLSLRCSLMQIRSIPQNNFCFFSAPPSDTPFPVYAPSPFACLSQSSKIILAPFSPMA